MALSLAWSCATCGSRMRTLFPKKQRAGVCVKRAWFPVRCTACGSPSEIEVPETQPVEGVATKPERDE